MLTPPEKARIKPIETAYKGYRFRSRLEARWAVFFDALHFDWQYEPEGFELPSGQLYLPDFRIVMQGEPNWFEIKPGDVAETVTFCEFMEALSPGSRGSILNDIPDPLHVRDSFLSYYGNDDRPYVWFSGGDGFGGNGWNDNCYRFCVCQACGVAGFEFEGRSARIGCGCSIHRDCDGNETPNHPKIIAALAAARGARFEHDERESYR